MKTEGSGLHWEFAVNFYRRPGVSESCLLLQDRCGVDVNLLLFALFLACEYGRLLTDDELADADARIAEWRRETVVPLRALRRILKTHPWSVPEADRQMLRSRLAEAELLAEQTQQNMLMAWARDLAVVDQPEPASMMQLTALLENVVDFHTAKGRDASSALSDPEVRRSIALICATAAPSAEDV